MKYFYSIFLLFAISSCSPSSNDNDPIVEPDNFATVSQYSPNNGNVNDVVTINGTNFGTIAAQVTVKFSTTAAEVISITNTEIKVKVPVNLQANIYPITLIKDSQPLTVGNYTVLQEIKLLAASTSGKFYEIGVSSGNLSLVSQTSYEFLSYFAPINIIQSETNVFFFDSYAPEVNKIIKYNLTSDETITQELTIPDTILGGDRGIVAWVYDSINNQIIAVVNENILINNLSTNYIVRIDPTTFEVTNTGITFNQRVISSMEISNNILYLSVMDNDHELTKINLNSGSVDMIELSDTFKVSKLHLSGNFLYAMKSTSATNPGAPIRINTDTFQVEQFAEDTSMNYGLASFFGNGFYNNNIYFNTIASNQFGYGILKFDVTTNEYTTLPFLYNLNDPYFRILKVVTN